MENKTNQHYVWKHYLNNWADRSNKIWALRNRNQIFQVNTRKINSQRYFYSVEDLSNQDLLLVKKIYIDSLTDDNLKSLLNGWISPLFLMNSICGGNGSIPEVIVGIQKNALENVYSEIESEGIKYLDKFRKGDLTLITSSITKESEDNLLAFILFMSFQYFRTKQMKDSVMKSLGEHVNVFDNFDSSWNITAIILATLFANNVANAILGGKLQFILLKSANETSFITGDQPVINLKATYETEEVNELELYYPLSPEVAILITPSFIKNGETCDKLRVKELNKHIFDQSLEQVFSHKKGHSTKFSIIEYSIIEPYKIKND